MCSSVCVYIYTRKSNPSSHTHIHLQTQINQYIQIHIIRIEMYANIKFVYLCVGFGGVKRESELPPSLTHH
jgi:hypothetical protein